MKNQLVLKIVTFIVACAMLAMSLCVLTSCENSNEDTPAERTQEEKETVYSIGVLADPQVLAAEVIVDPTTANPRYTRYAHHEKSYTKILDLSEAIFKTAVDNLIAEQVNVVFFIGDLTNTGGLASEQIVLEGCNKLRAAGIPVFVASGICDTVCDAGYTGPKYFTAEQRTPHKSIDAQKFKDMFANFGYNQAAFKDTNSISYAADIEGTNYRVLMIENADGYTGDDVIGLEEVSNVPMSDAQMQWIESVLQDSQRTGKEVFVISSLPVTEYPIPYYTYFMRDTYLTLDRGEELQKMFLDYGVNYVFSGHVHIGAENQVSSDSGDTLYEITTTALALYPSAYNIVEIKDDFTYLKTEKRVQTLNESYLPDYTTAETRAAVITDFNAYAKARYRLDFTDKRQYTIDHKHGNEDLEREGHELVIDFLTSLELYPAYVKDASGKKTAVLDAEATARYEEISHEAGLWMYGVDALKLYGSGEDSVEGILKPYGISMPDSKFKDATVNDYIMDVIYRMLEGTFVLEENGADMPILTNIFYAGCKMFADVDIFTKLNEMDADVKACDISIMVDKFLATDVLDIKAGDFLLSVISLFFPYLRDNMSLIYTAMKGLNDTAALINSFDLIAPVISAGIPELIHFTNANGELETDFFSLSKGELYGKQFISQILFPVITRTAIVL